MAITIEQISQTLADKYKAVIDFQVLGGARAGKTYSDLYPKNAVVGAHAELSSALANGFNLRAAAEGEVVGDVHKELFEALDTKRKALDGLSEKGKMIEGVDAGQYATAKTEFTTAEERVRSFLKGAPVVVVPQGENQPKLKFQLEPKSPVTAAFNKFEEETTKAHGLLAGHTGMLRTAGWAETIQHNYKRAQFWGEGLEKVQRAKGFAMCAAAVGSAVGATHAIVSDKDAEGEKRGTGWRAVELGGAVTLAGLVALRAPAIANAVR